MKPRILVVEDDEKSISMLTRILKQHGYEVIQARDGYEGIEAAKQAQPDLILLDILLPGLDGYAVAEELRSMPELGHVPILATSALPLLSNAARALEAGCNEYIEKPIDPVDLVEKVGEYLAMINQISRFIKENVWKTRGESLATTTPPSSPNTRSLVP